MFIGKPMQTIASREPDRQAIITKTETFLRMGGKIQYPGIQIGRQVSTSEVEKHSRKYSAGLSDKVN